MEQQIGGAMGTVAGAKESASHLGPYFWDVLYVVIGVGLVAVILVLVVLVVRGITSRQILIEPFTVAKIGEELGWSGVTLAHRLCDAIAAIQREGRSNREGELFVRPGELRDYVTVSAAGFGFTYQSLIQAVRDALKLSNGRLSGELVSLPQADGTPSRGISLVCRVSRSSGGAVGRWIIRRQAQYTHFPKWGRGSYADLLKRQDGLLSKPFSLSGQVCRTGVVGQIDQLVSECASAVLEIVDPYTLVAYHRVKGNMEEVERLIDVCLVNDNRYDDSWALNMRGLLARERREFASAETAFAMALDLCPGHAMVHSNWAMLLADQCQWQESIGHCEQALAIDPTISQALAQWADVLRNLGDFDAAIAKCGETLALDPGNARAYALLGLIHAARGEMDDSIRKYRQALLYEPRGGWLIANWAESLRLSRDFAAAVEKCEEGIKIDPRSPNPYNVQGLVLVDQRRYDEAIDRFREALDRKPTVEWVLQGWGNALRLKREFAAAEAKFKEVLDVNPRWAGGYNSLGLLEVDRRNYDAALTLYDRALSLAPGFAWIVVNRGRAHLRKGDYGRAIADATRALAINDRHADALGLWAAALTEMADYPGAIELYERAVRTCVPGEWIFTAFAYTLRRAENFDYARKMVARAVRLNRRSTDAWNAWGWVLFYDRREGPDRAAKAIAKFEMACDINGRDEWSLMGLARCLDANGEHDRAIATIKRAAEVNDRAAETFGTWGDILAVRAISDRTYLPAAIGQYEHALKIDPSIRWIRDALDRARQRSDVI